MNVGKTFQAFGSSRSKTIFRISVAKRSSWKGPKMHLLAFERLSRDKPRFLIDGVRAFRSNFANHMIYCMTILEE